MEIPPRMPSSTNKYIFWSVNDPHATSVILRQADQARQERCSNERGIIRSNSSKCFESFQRHQPAIIRRRAGRDRCTCQWFKRWKHYLCMLVIFIAAMLFGKLTEKGFFGWELSLLKLAHLQTETPKIRCCKHGASRVKFL